MSKPVNNNTYKISSGDTFYQISKKTGISVETLRKLNPNTNPQNLQIGTELVLSGSNSEYTIKKGDSFSKIAKELNISVKDLQSANPNIDPRKLQIGQRIRLAVTQGSETTAPKQTQRAVSGEPKAGLSPKVNGSIFTPKASDIKPKTKTSEAKTTLTQAKFEATQSDEVKNMKTFIKNKEGKETQPYIELNDKLAIGYGHNLVLKSQPKFIKEITQKTSDKTQRANLLKEALKKPENKAILKKAIEADIQAAVKLTGIGNVSIDIKDDLKLSDAQMELLLNADLKKAQNAMGKRIGKAALAKRTTAQKQVALDLFYNAGGNLDAPKFIEAFKKGDIVKAQEEIDFFHVNVYDSKSKTYKKKYYSGLIKRSYERMLLINDNKLTDASKAKLLDAYNKYLAQGGKPAIENFAKLEPILKK